MKIYILAAQKGLLTPSLPEDILKFQLHPIIRVLRVLGGLSTLFLITDRVQQYSLPIYYYVIAMIITFMFFIYHMYITYHRIKHIRYLLKSDKLDIRNSPLNRLATICSKILLCAKGACETAAPVGSLLGFMGGVDAVRQSKGHEPIFLPFLGNMFLTDSPDLIAAKQQRQDYSNLYKLSQQHQDLTQIETNFNQMCESNPGFLTQEEREELRIDLKNQQSVILSNKSDILKNINDRYNAKK